MTVPQSAVTAVFDWRSFFTLAERLGQEIGDEAAIRSAISRAYYAVFALASRRLRDQGCWQPTRDPHTRVWATYRNARIGRCKRIGDHGFNLLAQRRRADYDDRIGGIPAQQATIALGRARKILDLLDRLDPAESCCPPATAPPIATAP